MSVFLNKKSVQTETIEIIDAIERRGSFAAAAEELGKVPSALSYSIQKAEDTLGVALYVRQGRKSVLTKAGRALLDQGRPILDALNALAEEVQRVASGWETRIRVAVEAPLQSDAFFQLLQRFQSAHPDIELDVSENILGSGWEALLQDRVDLVVGAPGPVPQNQGIRAQQWQPLNFIMVVSPMHPLASHNSPLTKADLAGHRQVILHDNSREGVPRSASLFADRQRFFVHTMSQKIAAQKAGLGYGQLPLDQITRELENGELIRLKMAETMAAPRPNTYLAWKLSNRGKGLAALRALLAEMSSEKGEGWRDGER